MKKRESQTINWPSLLAAYEHGVSAGDPEAMDDLALTLRDGVRDSQGRVVVRRNLKRSYQLLRRAAEAGNVSAAFSLGYAYDNGLGVSQSTEHALNWYRFAARGGCSFAALNIATIYNEQRKRRLAFSWMSRAESLGDGDAALDVGYCYQYGLGVRRNIRSARKMYRRALKSDHISDHGRKEAMYQLGVSYFDSGTMSRATSFLEAAAADGDYPEAEEMLEGIADGRKIQPCRCRRDLAKERLAHASCPRHPRDHRPAQPAVSSDAGLRAGDR